MSKRGNSENLNEEKKRLTLKIKSFQSIKTAKIFFKKIDKVKSALRTIIKNKTRKLNMSSTFGTN